MKGLAEGQYIKHFQYGCGVITGTHDDRTTIDFDTHGIKKFVTSIMVLSQPKEPCRSVPSAARSQVLR